MGTTRHSPWIPRLLAMSTSSVLCPYVLAAVRVEHTREPTLQAAGGGAGCSRVRVRGEQQQQQSSSSSNCACSCSGQHGESRKANGNGADEVSGSW